MSIFRFQPPDEGGELGPPPGPFRFRTRQRRFRLPGGVMRWGIVVAALIIIFIVASIAKDIYADWLWFDSVGFRSVYRLRIVTRIWLFCAGMGVFLAFFGSNTPRAAAGRTRFTCHRSRSPMRHRYRPAHRAGRCIAAMLFIGVIFGGQAAGRGTASCSTCTASRWRKRSALRRDIGFYVFRLPVLNFIAGWSCGVILTVLRRRHLPRRLVIGGFRVVALRAAHVSLLLVVMLGLFIWRYWLRATRWSSGLRRGVRAAYTDIRAVAVTYVLMGLASLVAVAIVISTFQRRLLFLPSRRPRSGLWRDRGRAIYPATVQRLQVDRTSHSRAALHHAQYRGDTPPTASTRSKSARTLPKTRFRLKRSPPTPARS
jgi:uncharacterized membrane protein (UPF0182 family)